MKTNLSYNIFQVSKITKFINIVNSSRCPGNMASRDSRETINQTKWRASKEIIMIYFSINALHVRST